MIYLNNIMKKICITKMYLSKRNSIFFGVQTAQSRTFSNRGVCGYCYIITDIN